MPITQKRVLILGATGMLGHTLLRDFCCREELIVHATARSSAGLERWFTPRERERIVTPVDADNPAAIVAVLESVRPDVVINAIGVIKQLAAAHDPLTAIAINALLPHQLARECRRIEARLIQISSDCVFSGRQGNYRETDFADADDLYGRSKFLGEVDAPPALTLRTSIIGHELQSHVSLIDWFLAQQGRVKGFTRAIFSGFPTVEIARIIAEVVIPDRRLSGLYHLAAAPISKYDLLQLVAQVYAKEIAIDADDTFVCDRSLDARRFHAATGYISPPWEELVAKMHGERLRTCEKR